MATVQPDDDSSSSDDDIIPDQSLLGIHKPWHVPRPKAKLNLTKQDSVEGSEGEVHLETVEKESDAPTPRSKDVNLVRPAEDIEEDRTVSGSFPTQTDDLGFHDGHVKRRSPVPAPRKKPVRIVSDPGTTEQQGVVELCSNTYVDTKPLPSLKDRKSFFEDQIKQQVPDIRARDLLSADIYNHHTANFPSQSKPDAREKVVVSIDCGGEEKGYIPAEPLDDLQQKSEQPYAEETDNSVFTKPSTVTNVQLSEDNEVTDSSFENHVTEQRQQNNDDDEEEEEEEEKEEAAVEVIKVDASDEEKEDNEVTDSSFENHVTEQGQQNNDNDEEEEEEEEKEEATVEVIKVNSSDEEKEEQGEDEELENQIYGQWIEENQKTENPWIIDDEAARSETDNSPDTPVSNDPGFSIIETPSDISLPGTYQVPSLEKKGEGDIQTPPLVTEESSEEEEEEEIENEEPPKTPIYVNDEEEDSAAAAAAAADDDDDKYETADESDTSDEEKEEPEHPCGNLDFNTPATGLEEVPMNVTTRSAGSDSFVIIPPGDKSMSVSKTMSESSDTEGKVDEEEEENDSDHFRTSLTGMENLNISTTSAGDESFLVICPDHKSMSSSLTTSENSIPKEIMEEMEELDTTQEQAPKGDDEPEPLTKQTLGLKSHSEEKSPENVPESTVVELNLDADDTEGREEFARRSGNFRGGSQQKQFDIIDTERQFVEESTAEISRPEVPEKNSTKPEPQPKSTEQSENPVEITALNKHQTSAVAQPVVLDIPQPPQPPPRPRVSKVKLVQDDEVLPTTCSKQPTFQPVPQQRQLVMQNNQSASQTYQLGPQVDGTVQPTSQFADEPVPLFKEPVKSAHPESFVSSEQTLNQHPSPADLAPWQQAQSDLPETLPADADVPSVVPPRRPPKSQKVLESMNPSLKEGMIPPVLPQRHSLLPEEPKSRPTSTSIFNTPYLDQELQQQGIPYRDTGFPMGPGGPQHSAHPQGLYANLAGPQFPWGFPGPSVPPNTGMPPQFQRPPFLPGGPPLHHYQSHIFNPSTGEWTENPYFNPVMLGPYEGFQHPNPPYFSMNNLQENVIQGGVPQKSFDKSDREQFHQQQQSKQEPGLVKSKEDVGQQQSSQVDRKQTKVPPEITKPRRTPVNVRQERKFVKGQAETGGTIKSDKKKAKPSSAEKAKPPEPKQRKGLEKKIRGRSEIKNTGILKKKDELSSTAKKTTERQTKSKQSEVKENKVKKTEFYILLKNLPELPSETAAFLEALKNFIEAKSGGIAVQDDSIIFNPTQTDCLAVLKEKPDMGKFTNRLSQKGTSVYELPPPCSVVVSGDNDITSFETLILYLERVGGDVASEEKEETEDGNCYIVHFQHHDAVVKVLNNGPHKVQNVTLMISPYYQCDGGAIYDHIPHAVPIPKDVHVDQTKEVVEFLQRPCCHDLVDCMGTRHAELIFQVEAVTLHCILTPRVKQCRQLVKTWEACARQELEKYIEDRLQQTQIQVTDEVWEHFVQFVISEEKLRSPEVLVDVRNMKKEVVVVGLKTEWFTKVVHLLDEEKLRIQRDIKRTTVRKSGFAECKVRLLERLGFFQELSGSYEGMSIEVHNDTVTFANVPKDEIDGAIVCLYQKLETVFENRYQDSFSDEHRQFLVEKETREYVNEKIRSVGLDVEWELEDKAILIFTMEMTNPEKTTSTAHDIITQSVTETRIHLEDDAVKLFQTPEWDEVIQDITETHEHKFEMALPARRRQNVVIVATDDVHSCIVDKVRKFLDENLVREETLACDPISSQFADSYFREDFNKVQNDLKQNKVQIWLESDAGIKVRGTAAGIVKVKTKVSEILARICCQSKTLKNVGIERVLIEEMQKGSIKRIEKDTQCLTQFPLFPQEFEGTSVDPQYLIDDGDLEDATAYPQHGRTEVEQSSDEGYPNFQAKNGIQVHLVKGQIGQQQGHVLVCSTSPKLKLDSGAASKSLLQAGGPGLQNECNTKYPEGIKTGEVAHISGGRLECKEVFLTALPDWSGEGAIKTLDDIMTKCLTEASKHSHTSIVFAAMGTGQLSYPKETVAEVMFRAVINFDSNNPRTTLKEVRFILYQKDQATISAFECHEKLLVQGGTAVSYDAHAGNIKVELKIDDIASQKVDVIFSSTSPDMNLSKSGACRALAKVGGSSLQDECKKNFNSELKEGTVCRIGPGKLPCKSVYLTALPSHNAQGSEDALKDVVGKALELAKASSFQTVAMPALGTGFLDYPRHRVAQLMYAAITEFSSANPNSSINTVRIILHAKDHSTIQAFKAYVTKSKTKMETRRNRDLQYKPSMNLQRGMRINPFNAGSNSVKIRDIKLTVATGDILKEQTDAIVNSVTRDFKFLGAVAQQLLRSCPQLEKECRKKADKLIGADVVLTKASGLKVGSILHVVFQQNTAAWTRTMQKCLAKANKKNMRVISFPVLGTGGGPTRFAPGDIAGCLFDALDKFSHDNSRYSVNEVRLVVFHKQAEMVQPIMETLHKKAQAAAESANRPGKMRPTGDITHDIVEGVYNFVSGVKQKLSLWSSGWGSGSVLESDQKSAPKNAQKLEEKVSEVTVQIYSDKDENIQKCIRELDRLLSDMYTTAKIQDFIEIVQQLKPEQVKHIEDCPILVTINIDQNAGIITITGPKNDVVDAKTEIMKILRAIEKEKSEKNAAEMLYQQVVWQYEIVEITGMKLESYEPMPNLTIERAYKNNQNTVELPDSSSGTTYVIDFQKMQEYPKHDQSDMVNVIRKDVLKASAGIPLPSHWEDMKQNENIKMVLLQPQDPVYKTLAQTFEQQVRNGGYTSRIQFDLSKFKISKIERIQNITLYRQYVARKEKIEKEKPKLPANMPLERQVWHGTTPDAVTSIQSYGFNRSYCGKNGTWFGEGVYFATDASYSARGWLSGAPTTAGAGPSKGYVFSVKAVTGQYTKGDPKMRYLPPIDPKQPLVLYDSAVDNINNPVEFVIFHDTQAYPEHIITFTTS